MEIGEVKGDNKIDTSEVTAKAYAAIELAEYSKASYQIYKSTDIDNNKVDLYQPSIDEGKDFDVLRDNGILYEAGKD